MFPLDIEVWERFLDRHGDSYIGFAYDVKVGEKCKVHKHWGENYKRDAEVLSKLRIDVVGVKDEALDIIEVKPTAKASAIGQMLTYHHCFLHDFDTSKEVRTMIVAEHFDPNIIPILGANNIAYVKV